VRVRLLVLDVHSSEHLISNLLQNLYEYEYVHPLSLLSSVLKGP
jgi:hypothetical protein